MPLHEGRIVAVGNEADLLALRLVRRGESPLRRQASHLFLGQAADGEDGRRELLLRQTEQEVRLVLARVRSPQEPIAAADGVAVLASVVAGRDVLDAQRPGPRQQALELHLAVAPCTRQGGAAVEILAHEGGDHPVLERALQVDDVVRDRELRGNGLRVVEVIEGAAAAE